MTKVAAALIIKNGKFLICQRPAGKSLGLYWEFAGGKIEPGETKEEALIREYREELGVILSVGEVFTEITYEYPNFTLNMTLFLAEIIEGEPQLLEHNDMRWITPAEIENFEFCPADVPALEKIKAEYGK